MRLFKALAALLAYPTTSLQHAVGDIAGIVQTDPHLPARVKRELVALVAEIASGDLYDLQERYHLLFDRTRSLSLHLFEHVHGESRDRGQAMIDLKALYEAGGLAMDTTELPDFLPLFLEYLSTRPISEARDLLAETVHITQALAERLEKRSSAYGAAFRALVALAATQPSAEAVAAVLEEPDVDAEDLAALDLAWEDAPVEFGPGAAACGHDELAARLRAARRPAPGVERAPSAPRTVITHSPAPVA